LISRRWCSRRSHGYDRCCMSSIPCGCVGWFSLATQYLCHGPELFSVLHRQQVLFKTQTTCPDSVDMQIDASAPPRSPHLGSPGAGVEGPLWGTTALLVSFEGEVAIRGQGGWRVSCSVIRVVLFYTFICVPRCLFFSYIIHQTSVLVLELSTSFVALSRSPSYNPLSHHFTTHQHLTLTYTHNFPPKPPP
jgi:hypothetical protein